MVTKVSGGREAHQVSLGGEEKGPPESLELQHWKGKRNQKRQRRSSHVGRRKEEESMAFKKQEWSTMQKATVKSNKGIGFSNKEVAGGQGKSDFSQVVEWKPKS